MPTALITGITGQDGSYLTELLLEKGYTVHGIVRRTSLLERSRLRHLFADPEVYEKRLFLHYADLDDATTLRRVILSVAPDELYHLAGQSHVGLSFEIPESTCQLTSLSTLRILEIIRDLANPPRFYHASSSEVFGSPKESPQNEDTPFRPVTPYGYAKAFATQMVGIYRNSFGIHAVNGITFNHESPRRGENFVTRKVCRAAAAIKKGLTSHLSLGDTSARRDWGWAPDYVKGMWLSLQHSPAGDYVLATGRQHSVQDVVEAAFATVDLDWRQHLKRDERFVRKADPCNLVGDPGKARRELGWEVSIDFEEMIRRMTEAELENLG